MCTNDTVRIDKNVFLENIKKFNFMLLGNLKENYHIK